jgi:hypothetical protein
MAANRLAWRKEVLASAHTSPACFQTSPAGFQNTSNTYVASQKQIDFQGQKPKLTIVALHKKAPK